MAKILYIDIETSPNLVYTFGLRNAYIGIDQIVEPSRILGFSYMWDGDKKAKWHSEFHHPDGRIGMLREVHALLDEADIVVHYNGKRFDMPWIRGELIMEGFPPPSPVFQVDLYSVVRQNSRYASGKLDWTAKTLLGDQKVKHSGFGMWVRCLNNDPKAWAEMKKYALQDSELMPPIYHKLRPWIETGHPNVALLEGKESIACTRCASENYYRRGSRYTLAGRYPRYNCKDCGAWFRGAIRLSTTEGR